MADDQTRVFDDTEGAVAVTASPDGGLDRRGAPPQHGPTVIPEQYDMWVMSVDGADRRLLVEDYAHDIVASARCGHRTGIGSSSKVGQSVPTIVLGGQTYNLGQNDEIVMVTVGDE